MRWSKNFFIATPSSIIHITYTYKMAEGGFDDENPNLD